jgi:spore germination protein (amino acid permease)
MTDAKKYGLSDFQWAAVVVSAMLGAGIVTLPRTVADSAGRDGWISILIAGAATLLFAVIVWLLCRKFPTRTLPEFSIIILGKPLGILVSVVYVAYTFALGATALRIYTELLKTWVMIWTPMPVFLLAVLLPVVYISRMGAVTLGRVMEGVIYITVVVFLLYLVPLGGFDMLNLRPVGTEGLSAIISGVPQASFAFLGYEVMLVFFPFIVNREKVLRITILAIASVTLLYVGNTVLIYGVLGPEHTLLLKWPLINYLRIGVLPFLQRIDSLVLFLWTTQILAVVAIQYYAGTFTLATLTRRKYHDIWAIISWPLVYAIAVFPQSLPAVIALSDLVGLYGLVAVLGITGLLLAVAIIRGLDESKEEKAG